MIAVIAISAIAMALWMRYLMLLRCAPVQTPDGTYYARMGAGLTAPRPYGFRRFARLIEPTMEAWSAVTAVSMAVASAAGAAAIYITTNDVWIALASVSLMLCVPAHRRLWTWPVLLDAPTQAAMAMLGLLLLTAPLWIAIVAAVASSAVHERAPVCGACFALVCGVDPIHCAFVAVVPVIYVLCNMPFVAKPTKDDPEWLRFGVRDHLKVHAQAITNWKSMLLPLGGAALWMLFPSWQAALVAAVGYGGLLFAVDRSRIIAAVTLPLAVVVFTNLPSWAILPVLIATLTTTHDEV